MPSVAIVGGGFGGVGAAALLARAGHDDVTLFERGERLGGVWHHNTYPGAACDIPSHLYEYSFAPNPGWSRRYAPQPEIQAYVEDVARRFGVRARTSTEVSSAVWDGGRWVLSTSAGPFTADVLITACGQLSIPQVPPLPGLDSFAGPAFHTARWRHDVPLAGRRVAVIGTGCSAVQVVPAIADEVAALDVYQRSPGWTIPKLDFPYPPRVRAWFARFPALQRLDRAGNWHFHEFFTHGMVRDNWRLALLRGAGQFNIRRGLKDPSLRRRVTPTDHVGCKRVMLTDDWYPALARPHVSLISSGVSAITPGGVVARDGVERPADVLVLATGFKSHEFVAPMEITGRDGRTLADAWDPVARAYLGVTVPSFPNLFLLYGPNTNGGTGSVISTIESSIAHVLAALRELERAGASTIEVRPEAADAFNASVRAALAGTVWHSGCTNWYVDADGNDPSNWPWTWTEYRRRTAELAPDAYTLSG
ncbi:NAD(P)/FAD-dependent oxidoreductase [Solirubrobacter ginsenosidimutans]|uniref:NAD(P)/FAD-dependent oxidoreductase n=1 Tax=Solirubrobacter ginsenosidimutans TaxID=490573 RepID=A0A9X3S4T9_9ACTN|nr:NAD(P)/FAD-dependent oxidoreductase [Solirubrobacter ginsenosidimutans]MDA0160963.1 NAD(P)/FAD-dependent oxidoreductase [Solirubrobacter ginsenosidimutans]